MVPLIFQHPYLTTCRRTWQSIARILSYITRPLAGSSGRMRHLTAPMRQRVIDIVQFHDRNDVRCATEPRNDLVLRCLHEVVQPCRSWQLLAIGWPSLAGRRIQPYKSRCRELADSRLGGLLAVDSSIKASGQRPERLNEPSLPHLYLALSTSHLYYPSPCSPVSPSLPLLRLPRSPPK